MEKYAVTLLRYGGTGQYHLFITPDLAGVVPREFGLKGRSLGGFKAIVTTDGGPVVYINRWGKREKHIYASTVLVDESFDAVENRTNIQPVGSIDSMPPDLLDLVERLYEQVWAELCRIDEEKNAERARKEDERFLMREAAAKLALAEAQLLGLPALVGTKKQVVWAEQIRAKVIKTMPAHEIGAIAQREITAKFWIENRVNFGWDPVKKHRRSETLFLSGNR